MSPGHLSPPDHLSKRIDFLKGGNEPVIKRCEIKWGSLGKDLPDTSREMSQRAEAGGWIGFGGQAWNLVKVIREPQEVP
jgi:hypothetical protein